MYKLCFWLNTGKNVLIRLDKFGAFNRNFVNNSGKNKHVECLLSVFESFLAESERFELSIDLHL